MHVSFFTLSLSICDTRLLIISLLCSQGYHRRNQMRCYLKKKKKALDWQTLIAMNTCVFYFVVCLTTESSSFHRRSLLFCALDVSRALWFNWGCYLAGMSIPGKCSKANSLCFSLFCISFHWPRIHVSYPSATFISIPLEFYFQHHFLSYWSFPLLVCWKHSYKIILFLEFL